MEAHEIDSDKKLTLDTIRLFQHEKGLMGVRVDIIRRKSLRKSMRFWTSDRRLSSPR